MPLTRVVTSAQAYDRLLVRPETKDGLERFQWLEANFPGFNDRYIGGAQFWKIGKMYGLSTAKAKELAAWMEGD